MGFSKPTFSLGSWTTPPMKVVLPLRVLHLLLTLPPLVLGIYYGANIPRDRKSFYFELVPKNTLTLGSIVMSAIALPIILAGLINTVGGFVRFNRRMYLANGILDGIFAVIFAALVITMGAKAGGGGCNLWVRDFGIARALGEEEKIIFRQLNAGEREGCIAFWGWIVGGEALLSLTLFMTMGVYIKVWHDLFWSFDEESDSVVRDLWDKAGRQEKGFGTGYY